MKGQIKNQITARYLLKMEESIYQKIKDQLRMSDERSNYRRYLIATLTAMDKETSIKFPLAVDSQSSHLKVVDNHTFNDANEGLKYLVDIGIRTERSGMPGNFFFTLHDLLSDYQYTLENKPITLLKDSDLIVFLEHILEFTDTHTPILFSKKQFDILTTLMMIHTDPYITNCFHQLINDYCRDVMEIEWSDRNFLGFVHESKIDGNDYCVIQINQKYPQVSAYLTDLRQKIPPLGYLSEGDDFVLKYLISQIFLPKELGCLIADYCFETVEIGQLLKNFIRDHVFCMPFPSWSRKQNPLYSCLILLSAIQYGLPISCFPEILVKNEESNSKALEDPVPTLTSLMIEPAGFLNHFIEHEAKLDNSRRYLPVANLMLGMLDLVQIFLSKDARQKAVQCLSMIEDKTMQMRTAQTFVLCDETSSKAKKLIDQLEEESSVPPISSNNLAHRFIVNSSRPIEAKPASASQGCIIL